MKNILIMCKNICTQVHCDDRVRDRQVPDEGGAGGDDAAAARAGEAAGREHLQVEVSTSRRCDDSSICRAVASTEVEIGWEPPRGAFTK